MPRYSNSDCAERFQDQALRRGSACQAKPPIGWPSLLASEILIASGGNFSLQAADPTSKQPTLHRILENWKARQKGARSLHMTWDSKLPAYEVKPNDRAREDHLCLLHSELWLDGDVRSRFDQSITGGRGIRMIRDRDISSSFAWRSNSAHGEIWSATDPPASLGWPLAADVNPALATFARNPPWMTFRPLGLFEHFEAFQLVEIAKVDGVRCVKIERPIPSLNVVETISVDPARDDLIVLRESKVKDPGDRGRSQGIAFSISIQYRRDSHNSWIPSGWTTRIERPLLVAVSTVTACEINEKLSERIFTVGFPVGTAVIDRQNRELYTVGKDSAKTQLAKINRQSLSLHEFFEAYTDFAIEPQSFKDALDFIRARYQIQMSIDERAFQIAGIDLTSKVQCSTRGLTVSELFGNLSQQMARPVRFEIRNGTLVVTPATP